MAGLAWLCDVLDAAADEEEGHGEPGAAGGAGAGAARPSAVELATPALLGLGLYAGLICCVCVCARATRRRRPGGGAAGGGGFQMPGMRTPRDESEPLVPHHSARSAGTPPPMASPAAEEAVPSAASEARTASVGAV